MMYNFYSLAYFQVRLRETEWSFPVQVAREDTIVLVLRSQNGARRFLKAEIRGFEEGSRFIVVFRLGPSNGRMRYLLYNL